MIDDLSRLKDLPVPSPRPEAKVRAIEAAMKAFDEEVAGRARCESCSALAARNARFCAACGHRLRASKAASAWRLPVEAAIAASIAVAVTGGLVTSQFGGLTESLPSSGHPVPHAPISRQTAGMRMQVPSPEQPKSLERLAAISAAQQAEELAPGRLTSRRIGAARPRQTGAFHTWSVEHTREVEEPWLSGLRYGDRHAPGVELTSTLARAQLSQSEQAQISFNPVKSVLSEPVSTFSTNLDRSQLAFIRRELDAGRLPPKDAVDVDDLINSFDYAYPDAGGPHTPLHATVTVLPSPWNRATKLIHIAIKGSPLLNAGALSKARNDPSPAASTIARNVKAWIEFNPARVADYRLIDGSANVQRRGGFNNDQAAAEFGAGQTITAIYEITPSPGAHVASSRNVQAMMSPSSGYDKDEEYAFLTIRYNLPDKTLHSNQMPITNNFEKPSVEQVSGDVCFSVAVAAFGQLLRGEPYVNAFDYDRVIALAAKAKGEDPNGDRAEFLSLVRLTKSLSEKGPIDIISQR